MKKASIFLLLISLNCMAIADTHLCDPEMSLADISNCVYEKRRESQHNIKKAYNSALLRVKDKSALVKNQHRWYENTKTTCDKEISEGTLSGMNVDACLYRHNLKRISYLNGL